MWIDFLEAFVNAAVLAEEELELFYLKVARTLPSDGTGMSCFIRALRV